MSCILLIFILIHQTSCESYDSTATAIDEEKHELSIQKATSGKNITRHKSSGKYSGVCPEGCVCFYVEVYKIPNVPSKAVWVNCEELNSRMTYLPPATVLPEDIWALDVTLNQITNLNVMDSLPTLRFLKISANSLQRLEPLVFDNVSSLEELDLSYNNLTELPEGIFGKLTRLRVLKLQYNHIRHLSWDTFDDNRELEELDLSHNPLKIIYQEWFKNLEQLRILNVAATGLMTIDHETFHFTTGLQQLDLSENLLSAVPNYGLKMIHNLKKLILNENPIKSINDESFEMLFTLEDLELCNLPKLTEIQAKSFSDLRNLKKLTIADNPNLVHIDPYAFYGIINFTVTSDSRDRIKSHQINLKHISLSGNRLSSLNQFSFPWCSLEFLDLRKNPWNCTCSLSWIHDCFPVMGDPRFVFVMSSCHTKSYLLISQYRCAQPSKYRGIEIHRIGLGYWGCPKEVDDMRQSHDNRVQSNYNRSEEVKTVKLMIIMFGAIVLFFLGLAVAIVMKKHDMNRHERKRGSGSIYYVKAQSTPDPPSLI